MVNKVKRFSKVKHTKEITVLGLSVADNHSCGIDIKFKVVDDFGTVPNLLGS